MATIRWAAARLTGNAWRRPVRCAADAGCRRISFNWGAPQEVKAAKAAPALSKIEAEQHRQFIIHAVAEGGREGLVRERLGLLMADKLPFGQDVCFAMIAAGVRLEDLNKITYWTSVALDEGHSLPKQLAAEAIVAVSAEAQHAKAAQLVLGLLSDTPTKAQDDPAAESKQDQLISDHSIRHFVSTQPASVLISSSTSLIKTGHVSLAFRFQRAVVSALGQPAISHAAEMGNQDALIACLERMSVLWLPAGQAEACLQAYGALSQTGYRMPLSLVSQLLHAAAEAQEWQLCLDILDARHQIDAGEAGLLAMDASLKPIVSAAYTSAGVRTASALLSAASVWLGHSMPESADALASLLVQNEQWDHAQAVAQHLLRRPRGRSQAPPPMACVGAIAGHLLMQGQGHAAARMLFAAARAWDGRWRVPDDVSDAWVKAELAAHDAPTVAADTAARAVPRDWLDLSSSRPVAPWVGAPVHPPHARVSGASGLAAPSALLAHGMARGHSPSAFACNAVAQAAVAAGDHHAALEVAAGALVSASFDALVPAATARRTSAGSAAVHWSPGAVDAMVTCVHAAASALLQQGTVSPVAAFARIACDTALMHVGKADATKAARDTGTAAATALQWNALAALTHAAGRAAAAAPAARSAAEASGSELLTLAQRLHLLLPFAADHMHNHPPRTRPSQAASGGYQLLSVAECCGAAAGQALLSPAAQAATASGASTVPAMDVGVLALRVWLREQPLTASGAGGAVEAERWAVAMLQAAVPEAAEGHEGGDAGTPLLFPLGHLHCTQVTLQDTSGGAATLEGAAASLPNADGALGQAASPPAGWLRDVHAGMQEHSSAPLKRAKGAGKSSSRTAGRQVPAQPPTAPRSRGVTVAPVALPGDDSSCRPSLTIKLQSSSK